MNFQIMQQVAGKEFRPFIDEETNEPLVFNCPHKAAQEAAKLAKIKGVKFQPRPVKDANDGWKLREKQRFISGAYKFAVWTGEVWWKHEIVDHYVHVSVKDPTRIAFTKNAMDGAKDIQTAMKPGKYLTEYFSKVLTAEEIREAAMQHSTTFENKELFFASTPEEIQAVYKPSLGNSCFSGTKRANLYGSGDFAVAYIKDDSGEITARAVCAPGRKIFTRPYGDYYRLGKLLEASGYKLSESRKPWIGLRVLKAHHWNGFYSDFGGYTEPDPTEPEKYLVFTD